MSLEENKALIRRYIQAIDDNTTGDWSVLDEFIHEDFVAHHAAIPGATLDREGIKHAAEVFRSSTPGTHEFLLQVAEGDLVVSDMRIDAVHAGDWLGVAATNRPIQFDAVAIHRIRDGKIVEYWAVTDHASVFRQIGALPAVEA